MHSMAIVEGGRTLNNSGDRGALVEWRWHKANPMTDR